MKMVRGSYLFLFLSLIFTQESDSTAFVRYYRTDHDFISGKTLLSSERGNAGYFEVEYNDSKNPIRKKYITSNGNVEDETLFFYDTSNVLKKQAWVNDNGDFEMMEVYGEEEQWSKEFRLFAFPDKDRYFIDGQTTRFYLNTVGQAREIEFKTITGEIYGRINLEYDYRGLLVEESWLEMPANNLIRKFVYEVNLMTGVRKIWEYGRGNELVSHEVLEMAPEDELYITPPPRTGNILDESDIIMKDIVKSGISTPSPVMVPKTEFDMLYLLSGETYQVEIVSIDNSELRFRIADSKDLLTIQLKRVKKAVSKWGNLVYPF